MDIKNITIFGTGLIGAGWATHLLVKGFRNIYLYDINDDCIKNGLGIIDTNLDFLVNEGVITQDTKNEMLTSLKLTIDPKTAVENADLIIENGPEKAEIKQSIIKTIEDYCKDEAVISSSTTGLHLSVITQYAKHPERIFGCHPYHPVYLLPLLEVNKIPCTDMDKLNETMDFFRSIDKKPVILLKESDGYIGSRLMTALLRESSQMVLDGVCTMQDIDDAFCYGPGMRYALFGIFTTLQLAGGAGGIGGMMNGPIMKSTANWLENFANWTKWPEEVLEYWENGIQEDMNKLLANRDEWHGRNNEELQVYRDKGLVSILKAQHML